MFTPTAKIHAMSRRRSYDVTFKMNAVECARKESKEAAVREFGVATKSICLWCSQKEQVSGEETKRSRAETERSEHGGSVIACSWIVGLQSRNLRVSCSITLLLK